MLKMTKPTMDIFFTKFPIWICKGVFSSAMDSRLFPIFPNWVWLPMAVTLQIAKPLVTIVPWKTRLFPYFSFLNTGSESPVRMDSFTEKSLDWRITPSAGIKLPSSVWMKSPSTISSLGISRISPFRMTLLLGCDNFFSKAMAFLLLDSW